MGQVGCVELPAGHWAELLLLYTRAACSIKLK